MAGRELGLERGSFGAGAGIESNRFGLNWMMGSAARELRNCDAMITTPATIIIIYHDSTQHRPHTKATRARPARIGSARLGWDANAAG